MVAQQETQWSQAERHFKQALSIYGEFNDKQGQATTLHQLGRVAQEQHHTPESDEYFKQALAIFIELKDDRTLRIVVRSLARSWKASGSERIIDTAARALGVEQDEVRARFEEAREVIDTVIEVTEEE